MSQVTARKEISPQTKHPKYVRIQQRLLKQVQSGSIPVGEALPKEKELAATLNVAVGTLRQAIQRLVDDGVVRRIPGKGTFVNSPRERQEQVRTNVFSLIVPGVREDPNSALIEGVEAASFKMDRRVLVGNSNNEVDRQEKLLQHAVVDQVAGVVLVPTTFSVTPTDHIEALRKNHIPIVFCHRAVEGVAAPLVTWSHIDVGRMAARAFVLHGRKRITAWVNHSDAFIETVGAGIRQVLTENNIDTANYKLHCCGKELRGLPNWAEFCTNLKELFDDPECPNAILCFNSFDAEQVYLAAGELGIKIPDELSLIYFGSDQRESALSQRFTCIAAPEAEVGLQVIKMLEAMEAGWVAHDNNHKVEVPLTLLPGETLEPAIQTRASYRKEPKS